VSITNQSNEDGYYNMFRFLKQKAQEIYNPPRLQEAQTFEDVARVIRYSFDGANLAAVAKSVGIDNVNQFAGLLEFGAAIARIQIQVSDGGWD